MVLKLRFRHVPTYGNGVIRRFTNNTSEMKKLAARDFEDILQARLFPPEHDVIIQSLLYRFAHWHALAKLRMHSETTLSLLDQMFKRLSRQLRKFSDFTCTVFTTMELPKEKAACERKTARERSALANPVTGGGNRKTKKFNLSTYKFHAMGDYVRSIWLFGTTDSFTTQIVCEYLTFFSDSF